MVKFLTGPEQPLAVAVTLTVAVTAHRLLYMPGLPVPLVPNPILAVLVRNRLPLPVAAEIDG